NGPGSRENPDISASGASRTATPVLDRVWGVRWLWQVGGRTEQAPETAKHWSVDVPLVVAAVFLTGLTVGVGRLSLGLWAVHRYRRAGRRIDDPTLNELTAELQKSLGCRRHVVLSECPNLSGPATAGWLRPVLLLPASWREWD